ncbi:MAG TPA: hypothetical protein VNL18_10815, partial [Gemmatimonadales bacterium]|nr:hypothetical protein [Gemmatimonadales bacterium]
MHLGSGALGLGFVAYLGRRAGLNVVLANRRQGSGSFRRNESLKLTRRYRIDVVGEIPSSEWVQVQELLYTDSDIEELLARVSDPSTILLTTALKDGLARTVPVISRLIEARVQAAPQSPLFVIACENRLDSTWLRTQITEHAGVDPSVDHTVHFLPCVADRICSEVRYDEDSQYVFVMAEPYARWTIEKTHHTAPLEQALRNLAEEGVVEFVGDIAPYRTRKLWLVNGPHLVLAILARKAGEPRLNVFLRSGLNALLFRRIQEGFSEAVRLRTAAFVTTDLEFFNVEILERFRNYPDTAERIMKRLSRTRL